MFCPYAYHSATFYQHICIVTIDLLVKIADMLLFFWPLPATFWLLFVMKYYSPDAVHLMWNIDEILFTRCCSPDVEYSGNTVHLMCNIGEILFT
jgi:predicted membrane protein